MKFPQTKRICVITGHYGSGKTNIAVNMALDLKKSGERVTIVDLDIVNPYFRTADFKDMLEQEGIKTILPMFANTNLDIPSLPAAVNSVFDDESSYYIIDVGGDDAGAIALGRYAGDFLKAQGGYDMLYVINERRYLTNTPEDAAALLTDIEAVSRLKATALVNNTNLGKQTTLEILTASYSFAKEVSRLTALPIAFTTINEAIAPKDEGLIPVKIYVNA